MTLQTVDRFWAKVERRGPDECWPWRGAANFKGYGRFYLAGGPFVQSTRYSYELAHGPIPVGAHMLHRCDNPPCVNPAHLFLGTAADNARDMAAKYRATFKENRCGLLTPEEVRRIRAMAGTESQAAIGMRFGVSQSHVSAIIRGARREKLVDYVARAS